LKVECFVLSKAFFRRRVRVLDLRYTTVLKH
jgi:hypothetical protein